MSSHYTPDQVIEDLATYIEAIPVLADYAQDGGDGTAAWRRSYYPLMMRTPAEAASLSFSFDDRDHSLVGVEDHDGKIRTVRYEAEIRVQYTYQMRPDCADEDWRKALLAGHHLLMHFVDPRDYAPKGMDFLCDQRSGLRKDPTQVDGWLLCEVRTVISYVAPATWEAEENA